MPGGFSASATAVEQEGLNSSDEFLQRALILSVSGLPGMRLAGDTVIDVDGAASRMIPVKVRAAPGTAPGTHRLVLEIADEAGLASSVELELLCDDAVPAADDRP